MRKSSPLSEEEQRKARDEWVALKVQQHIEGIAMGVNAKLGKLVGRNVPFVLIAFSGIKYHYTGTAPRDYAMNEMRRISNAYFEAKAAAEAADKAVENGG